MNRASSKWTTPTVHAIDADKRTVLFQYHTRNHAGVHILEFRHSFPKVLFNCQYGSDEYFEAFRTRIDPMQNHMEDCLNYSFGTCCVCEARPTKRVLLATKYILNYKVSVVKNLTAAICQLSECEEAASASMKEASEQLERQFEVIEINLWPTPDFLSKRITTLEEPDQTRLPPELKDFHPTRLSFIASESGNSSASKDKEVNGHGPNGNIGAESARSYETVPIVLRRTQSFETKNGETHPRVSHEPKEPLMPGVRPNSSPDWLFGPIPNVPKRKNSTLKSGSSTASKSRSKSFSIDARSPPSTQTSNSFKAYNHTMDIVQAAREGPVIKPRILQNKTKVDNLIRGPQLRKERSIDLLDAIKSLTTTSSTRRPKTADKFSGKPWYAVIKS